MSRRWTFNSKCWSTADILLFSGWPSVVWAVRRLIFTPKSISAEVQWSKLFIYQLYETCFERTEMKCRRNKSQRSQTGSQTRSYPLQKSYLAISLQMIRDVISVQWLLVVTANEVFWKILNLGFISLSVQQTPWNLIIRISFIRFIRGN